MNKVKDFLEKNIQWVAIGAGALYLIWMVYSFVLTNTAWQVPVGGEAKSPGEVDAAVEQIATTLDDKIKHGPKIDIKVPNFQTAVDLNPKPMPTFDLAWANSPTQDVTLPAAPGTTPIPGTGTASGNTPVAPGAPKVVELPKIPAATELATASGRSNVMIPTPAPAIAAGGDPNAAPAQPGVVPAANGTDIDWVSVAYKIPIDQLAKEFQRTNIPAQQQGATCFLDVELVREELQTDGSWGPPTVCPKLTTSTQPPGGVPPDNAGRQALQQYENWAVGATVELLQPKFYDWAKGDQWALSKDYVGIGIVGDNGAPLILDPNTGVRPGFDPNQFVNLDPKMQQQVQQQMNAMQPPLTNAEKRLIAGARQKAIQQRAAENSRSRSPANRGPTGGPGGGGYGGPGRGGPGGEGGYAPEDNLRPGGRPPGFGGPPPGYPPPYPPGMGGGDMGDNMGAGPAQQQQANYASMFPLPQQGKFDPRQLVAGAANPGGGPQANMSTIVGWATDWKAEPGKTYRYMIRYKIENPIWATINVAKNKADAEKFALASADSAWTDPVQAKNILEFFFTSANTFGRATATVTVFKYENGAEHKAVFNNVAPGDSIGMEKDGIDYSTGYTLVDLRPDLTRSDRTMAWIITPESQLTKRDIRADSESPMKQKLEQEIQAATPPAAAAAVGPGGAPAIINPTR